MARQIDNRPRVLSNSCCHPPAPFRLRKGAGMGVAGARRGAKRPSWPPQPLQLPPSVVWGRGGVGAGSVSQHPQIAPFWRKEPIDRMIPKAYNKKWT